jgi:hypothetical protein
MDQMLKRFVRPSKPPVRTDEAVARSDRNLIKASPGPSPRARLALVAAGHEPLRREDIEALLTEHVLATDHDTRMLSERFGFLVETLFAKAGTNLDVGAIADMATRLSALHRGAQAELRKTIELLVMVSRTPPPTVKIMAAGQVNVGGPAQQVNGALDLGGRRR